MPIDPQPQKPPALDKLEAYALERLAASRYSGASHPFRAIVCPSCGLAPLRLIVVHHTGSRKGNFRGQILAECTHCGESRRIYSFTGQHRVPEREETPTCRCGNDTFHVAECERIEGDDGLPGFVDEGVVVGQCAACGRNRVIIEAD